MAYPSRLLSHERPETSPRAAGDRGAGEMVDWASVDDDLDVAHDTGANMMVVGPEWLVMEVVRRVIAGVPASIVIPCEAGRLPLSPLSMPSGTLVFRDVNTLDPDGQALLSDWLERAGAGGQIVSTASAPLLPLVDAGTFDSGLYYRLNTVYIGLGQ